ncbi:radial spoke head 10 homolog B [Brachionichthys hirsutus]|uniref:radial spoke head 10 homolog B n=1 Tax=Brachionichthys hirsutus TaxID=412623 RepID=UPI003604DC5A
MIQVGQKKETAIKNDKEQSEALCGNAERRQTTEEKENGKRDAKSSLSDVREELPTLFPLAVRRYEGETFEGQFHGQGVAHFEGGHMYKGEFVCNKPTGEGRYTWPGGSSYNGTVYNGIRHGTGTYKSENGTMSYTGQWHQGKRHGKGVFYYNRNETSWYDGDWVKNNKEGWGVRRYPSGNLYSGGWKNNLRHGGGTMEWLRLGQQHVGTWLNGVQHGGGTHTWTPRHADGARFSPCNRYTGGFLQGRRHGRGAFCYAGGVTYEGEWSDNRRHAEGTFTFKDGRVFEGELTDDQMMARNLEGNAAPVPLCGPSSVSLLPDMALNAECLLHVVPETKRDIERKQVELVILTHAAELRSIYRFYSRLGHAPSADKAFSLTRLQLWRLLKDCNVPRHNITLTQINHLMGGDAAAEEIHSPFTPVLLSTLLGCLVVVAYLMYREEMASQKDLLTACFSRLMTDNILPNAKKVKGFLFRQPDRAAVALNYVNKCFEIYQAFCNLTAGPPRDNQTMTYRDLLFMFKDLHLLDNNLTSKRLLEVMTAESLDPGNPSSCMDLEISFLEFFEVLLGAAEVKCQEVPGGPKKGQPPSSHDDAAQSDGREVQICRS